MAGSAGGHEELATASTVAMNRGFHAFFRQYYNLRDLLRRVDPALSMLTAGRRIIPLIDGDGRRDTLPRIAADAAVECVGVRACAVPLFGCVTWCASTPVRLPRWPRCRCPTSISRSTTSTPRRSWRASTFPTPRGIWRSRCSPAASSPSPTELSAAELATMFHIYFLGSSEGLIFDVANANFDIALWNPLRTIWQTSACGSTRRVGDEHRPGRRRTFQVQYRYGDQLDADAVVLATDVTGLQRIVGELAGPWRRPLAGADRRAAYRRPVHGAAAVAGPPGRRRTGRRFLGTGGHAPLDNISVLDRYERQAARVGAGAPEALSSNCIPTRAGDRDDLQQRHAEPAARALPGDPLARVVRERMLRRSDCPLFAPGDFAHRPDGRDAPCPVWRWPATVCASICRWR